MLLFFANTITPQLRDLTSPSEEKEETTLAIFCFSTLVILVS